MQDPPLGAADSATKSSNTWRAAVRELLNDVLLEFGTAPPSQKLATRAGASHRPSPPARRDAKYSRPCMLWRAEPDADCVDHDNSERAVCLRVLVYRTCFVPEAPGFADLS